MEQVPQMVSRLLLSLTDNKILLLMLINIFLIFVGMIVDALSGILLVTPLLYPVILATGVHPIHFAAIIGVNLRDGDADPPDGGNHSTWGRRRARSPWTRMLKPIMIFILTCYVPVILLTTYWEPLSLAIPGRWA